MSATSRIIGTTFTVSVLGVEYELPCIQFRHISAAQTEMQRQRPPILRDAAEACSGLEMETRRVFAEAALAEYARIYTITIGEALLWLTQERDGIAFLLTSMIREVVGQGSPRIPARQQVAEWIDGLAPEALSEIVDCLSRASGRDQLGNSRTPSATATG